MHINALSEVLILVGVILLIVWVIVKLFPPKGINALYGYRTPRSMKDTESWDHAQRVSNLYMLGLAVAFLIIGGAFLFVDLHRWTSLRTMVVTVAIVIFGFGVLIFQVEKSR